jgi:hypothetical protein
MVSIESFEQPSIGTALNAPSLVAVAGDFEFRWAAWVERGRIHEQHVRQRLAVAGVVIGSAAAILYAFLG